MTTNREDITSSSTARKFLEANGLLKKATIAKEKIQSACPSDLLKDVAPEDLGKEASEVQQIDVRRFRSNHKARVTRVIR